MPPKNNRDTIQVSGAVPPVVTPPVPLEGEPPPLIAPTQVSAPPSGKALRPKGVDTQMIETANRRPTMFLMVEKASPGMANWLRDKLGEDGVAVLGILALGLMSALLGILIGKILQS